MAKSYYQNTNILPLKKGSKELLEFLYQRKISMGIATSNSRELVELSLNAHGIGYFFNCIVTSDEVERSKPFPDVFLQNATLLKIKDTSRIIVFEDNFDAGFNAKKAGFKVVGIKDLGNKSKWPLFKKHFDFCCEHSLLESLEFLKNNGIQ
jgi:HAD superfamily hydrolase (TIGR01509 family)